MADSTYAEVIGDPVGHSLSPVIHRHWLQELGLRGDYRATRCTATELPDFLERRRADPGWRGCNVTMPLKKRAAALLDELEPDAAASGAVNCVIPVEGRLRGFNTDLDGIATALGAVELRERRAVVIGSGGAARAALVVLARRGAHIVVLAREGPRRHALARLGAVDVALFDEAEEAIAGAAVVINAAPLGMEGAPPMPAAILDGLARSPGALAFDMVYRPQRTAFLAAAEAAGLRTTDGLTMLVGQARRAFALFFGEAPPPGDAAVRALLRQASPAD